MSSGKKPNTNNSHWNDIVNIVNRSNPPTAKGTTTDLQGADMTHDEVIYDFINSEVDRTQVSIDTHLADSTSQESAISWKQKIKSAFTNLTGGGFTGEVVGGARGFALAGLCALVLVPIVYKTSIKQDISISSIASNSPDVVIQEAASSIGRDSDKYINYGSNQLGIAEGKQTEIFKAFMTGVVQTDYGVLSSESDSELEAQKIALLEYHSMSVIQAANTQQAAEAAYKQALSFYTSSDELNKWLNKGMIIELIYLTASSGLDTGNYLPLVSVLGEYGNLTQGVSYEGQSDKYYEEHGMLQKFVASVEIDELTDADVKAIRKHARNIKVRIK